MQSVAPTGRFEALPPRRAAPALRPPPLPPGSLTPRLRNEPPQVKDAKTEGRRWGARAAAPLQRARAGRREAPHRYRGPPDRRAAAQRRRHRGRPPYGIQHRLAVAAGDRGRLEGAQVWSGLLWADDALEPSRGQLPGVQGRRARPTPWARATQQNPIRSPPTKLYHRLPVAAQQQGGAQAHPTQKRRQRRARPVAGGTRPVAGGTRPFARWTRTVDRWTRPFGGRPRRAVQRRPGPTGRRTLVGRASGFVTALVGFVKRWPAQRVDHHRPVGADRHQCGSPRYTSRQELEHRLLGARRGL
mmetsp:Transcript_25413/g.80236  ORF Transcript_25413/g.80236 Transcript_25413/m.80236 type:complete len:301 (-) Transcript_25413:1557-2459(-)